MSALLDSSPGPRLGSVRRPGVFNRFIALGAIALLPTGFPSGTAWAQSLASPFGTVSQKVDSTTITVEYYRPSARGRTIFGGVVRWGAVWTPGANWATTLEVDRDVRIEDQPLPRGKYSVWMIPVMKPDSWTVILSRAARRFHVVHPVRTDDALRFRVPVDLVPHLEMLTFSFPVVTRNGTTLALQWAGTLVPMRLEIQSARPAITAAHSWSSYAGTYQLRGAGSDSTAPPIPYEVIDRGSVLWVRTTPDAVEPGLDPEFDLIPTGGDDFHPRQYKNGKLIGDEVDELIVFHFEGTRATGFEVRGIAEDKILARGTRVRPPRSPGGRGASPHRTGARRLARRTPGK
jgi:hypothetical protein